MYKPMYILHWQRLRSQTVKTMLGLFAPASRIFVPQRQAKIKTSFLRMATVGNSNALENAQKAPQYATEFTNAPFVKVHTLEPHVQEVQSPPPSKMPHPPTGNLKKQVVLPTPVKVAVLDFYLEGYGQDKRTFLIDGFSKGFPLGTVGEVPPSVS